MAEAGKAYFFRNYPDSRPQPDGGSSAWRAAAFISAVDEGLAGIQDAGVNYDEISFAPKFPVTHYTELRYLTGYEVSGAKVDVRYILTDIGRRYDVDSPAKKIHAHILLPKGKLCTRMLLNGQDISFTTETVGQSDYVNAEISVCGKVSIEILFK